MQAASNMVAVFVSGTDGDDVVNVVGMPVALVLARASAYNACIAACCTGVSHAGVACLTRALRSRVRARSRSTGLPREGGPMDMPMLFMLKA